MAPIDTDTQSQPRMKTRPVNEDGGATMPAAQVTSGRVPVGQALPDQEPTLRPDSRERVYERGGADEGPRTVADLLRLMMANDSSDPLMGDAAILPLLRALNGYALAEDSAFLGGRQVGAPGRVTPDTDEEVEGHSSFQYLVTGPNPVDVNSSVSSEPVLRRSRPRHEAGRVLVLQLETVLSEQTKELEAVRAKNEPLTPRQTRMARSLQRVSGEVLSFTNATGALPEFAGLRSIAQAATVFCEAFSAVILQAEKAELERLAKEKKPEPVRVNELLAVTEAQVSERSPTPEQPRTIVHIVDDLPKFKSDLGKPLHDSHAAAREHSGEIRSHVESRLSNVRGSKSPEELQAALGEFIGVLSEIHGNAALADAVASVSGAIAEVSGKLSMRPSTQTNNADAALAF